MSTELKKNSDNLYSNASFGGGGGGGGGNDRETTRMAQATPPRPTTMDPTKRWVSDSSRGVAKTLIGGKANLRNGDSPLVGQNGLGNTDINH
jgi:hypothetical protein